MKLFNGIGRAGRWLFRGGVRPGQVKAGKRVPAEKKMSTDIADDELKERVAKDCPASIKDPTL